MRIISTLLGLLIVSATSPLRAQETFTGRWETTYGLMTLSQKGGQVEGSYVYEGNRCTIEGKVAGKRLTFSYQESSATGDGWFDLSADGRSFTGKYREKDNAAWRPWVGKRPQPGARLEFEGLWNTSFGRMRLIQDGDSVHGVYPFAGGSTIAGKLQGKRLTFRYQEPVARGEGWFELASDSKSFLGKWKAAGSDQYQEWNGSRVDPVPGRAWLVVLEANWETDLSDQEYAFGGMLRTFFARAPNVRVRHRFFSDGASLQRWCAEVTYLAEPVVLVIASHGSAAGVFVNGHTIGAKDIAAGLRHARGIKLLHFSACQIMKAGLTDELVRSLDKKGLFPISGYTTVVDWAASVIIEFMYFDMILSRGMDAAGAAEQLTKLLPFSGDNNVPGAAIRAAGFRLVTPGK